jgi:hypothetical protein
MRNTLSPDEERELKDAIATVQQFVSAIDVSVSEAGATLFIDNEEVGTSPFTSPVAIDVGPRALRVRKDGFQEITRKVDVASGRTDKVTFKLEPLVRTSLVTLRVEGAPAASIFIDGTDMGPAPFKGEVPVGRHTFEARAPGFVVAQQTSEILYKQPMELVLSLSKERHEGKVKVTTTEADAVIEINGKPVGKGNWEGVLPSGGHQLVVRKKGFQTYSTDVALADDQVRTIQVPLRNEDRTTGWIWWSIGALAVLGGGAAASAVVFQTAPGTPVSGTLPDPGSLVPTSKR